MYLCSGVTVGYNKKTCSMLVIKSSDLVFIESHVISCLHLKPHPQSSNSYYGTKCLKVTRSSVRMRVEQAKSVEDVVNWTHLLYHTRFVELEQLYGREVLLLTRTTD